MRYRDAAAAIEWLCGAFGFARHAVYAAEDGSIVHAELTLGSGMIMLGSAKDDAYGKLLRHPEGGGVTCSVSLIVADADAVYARVRAAGGEIVFDIEDKHYGGRGFACRDLEGYLWHVGTYDPWTANHS